jgi:hypothetical protein
MSESIQLEDPLFKLVIRFGNGEVATYIVKEPINTRTLTPELRYAVVSSFSLQNPSQGTEVAVFNLKDVTYIKTERVKVEVLTRERRMAGIRSIGPDLGDDRSPKTLSQLTFI